MGNDLRAFNWGIISCILLFFFRSRSFSKISNNNDNNKNKVDGHLESLEGNS